MRGLVFGMAWILAGRFAMIIWPGHDHAFGYVMAAPFIILALLGLIYISMFRMSAYICWLYDGISEHIRSWLPRNDIPRHKNSASSTAFSALLRTDKRDLLYFLTAGPSRERYFILRDISDKHLAWCIRKIKNPVDPVITAEYERRMNGENREFDRLESGRIL